MVNPFVPDTPLLKPLKTSENLTVFWCFQGGRERERVHWKGMRMKEEMFYETQSQVFVKKVNFLKTKRCLKSIKRLPMLRRSPNPTMDTKIHPNPILWQIHWGKGF